MTNITPGKARALLDTARQEAGDGQRPVTVAANHAPLAEAAPALAELVANLHYEYAVQVPVNGNWEYTKDDQYGPEVLSNPRNASWYPSRHAAKTWADLWDDGEDETRIVRRLATDPEVVE